MRTVLSLLFTILSFVALAQRECGSLYYQQANASNLQVSRSIYEAQLFVQQNMHTLSGVKGAVTAGVIRIPVVVHVVYATDNQNISDEQIKSGIEALNRDFRRRNSDSALTPVHFKKVAADVEIEFALATADPYGRSTTGIVRRKTSVKEWQMNDKIKFTAQGGDDAWDSNSYLNIWIGNLPRVLGYSSMLGGPADVDGIVLHYGAYGTIGAKGPYNMGRTLVHEAGHWLGLQHLWGDTDCGDDGVSDTPQQAGFTSGCPTGFISTCNNGTAGDMYMNYMDFTNDACMNLFTLGQKHRMRLSLQKGGPRYKLLSSKGLSQPTVEEAAPVVINPPAPVEEITKPHFSFFPNPATNEIVFTFNDQSWLGKEIRFVNINGTVVKKVVVAAPTQRISLTQLQAGMYLIMGENNNQRMVQKLVKMP